MMHCLCVQGTWEWSDGTDLTYTNWKPLQPGGGTSENCMRMDTDQLWIDWACSGMWYYVCQREALQ